MLGSLGSSSARSDDPEQAQAASCIQRRYRHRLSQREEAATRVKSAIQIQRSYRGYRARCRYQEMSAREGNYGKNTLHMMPAFQGPQSVGEATPLQRLRLRVWLFMEESDSSTGAKITSLFILVTIIFSIVCFTMQTMPELRNVDVRVWDIAEVCTTMVFSVEYLVRLSVCTVAGITVLQWMRDPANVCDLLAITPWYIQIAIKGGNIKFARVLRLIRLFRLFRIFKLGRYSAGMRLMFETIRQSAQALGLLIFLLSMSVVVYGSVLFYVERFSCPARELMSPGELATYLESCRFGGFLGSGRTFVGDLCCDENANPADYESIAAACWLAIVTMTTLGYGDKYPKSLQGQFVGVACMLSGILLIALPTAIVGHQFQDVYRGMLDEQEKVKNTLRNTFGAPRAAPDTGMLRALSRGNMGLSSKESPRSTPTAAPKKSPGASPSPKASPSRKMQAPSADVAMKLMNMTDRNCNLKQKLGELQARESQLQQTLKEEIRELIAVLERAPLRPLSVGGTEGQ